MSTEAITVLRQPEPPAPTVISESAALIAMIERAARDPAVDLDKMERLFDIRQRMAAQQAKTDFLAALSAMQAELPAAVRRGTGHNSKKYARFEDVVEALRPSLKTHGFSLTYRIKQATDKITVIGVLGHCGGHSEETEITLPADASGNKNGVQAWASSVSYGKRYVSLTLTGIATDDDDDGKAAGSGETISEAQEMELRDAIEASGRNIAIVCRHYGLAKLADVPADKFAIVLAAVKKPIRKVPA